MKQPRDERGCFYCAKQERCLFRTTYGEGIRLTLGWRWIACARPVAPEGAVIVARAYPTGFYGGTAFGLVKSSPNGNTRCFDCESASLCGFFAQHDRFQERAESRRGMNLALAAAGDGGAGFAVGGATAFGFALIPELFTLGERDLDFDLPVLEVHAGRDEGMAFLPGLRQKL
jgi:hypothetical protein